MIGVTRGFLDGRYAVTSDRSSAEPGTSQGISWLKPGQSLGYAFLGLRPRKFSLSHAFIFG